MKKKLIKNKRKIKKRLNQTVGLGWTGQTAGCNLKRQEIVEIMHDDR